MMNYFKHLQPVLVANQKLVIPQQSVSVNVEIKVEEAIKNMMLASVGDHDTRRDVLSTEIFLSRLSFDIISFIQGKEMGRHVTLNSCTISAVSSFQGQKNQSFNVGEKVPVCPLPGLLNFIL